MNWIFSQGQWGLTGVLNKEMAEEICGLGPLGRTEGKGEDWGLEPRRWNDPEERAWIQAGAMQKTAEEGQIHDMFTQHTLPLSLTYHLHLGRNHTFSDPRSLLLSEVILPSGDVRGLK